MRASAAVKQEATPTPFASAAKSEFVWPVRPEELARVVFDNKDPERKVTAPSAREEERNHPETPTGGEPERRGTSANWWVPALLLVTGFESIYLGVKAVHDWRRSDDPTHHQSVLPSQSNRQSVHQSVADIGGRPGFCCSEPVGSHAS